MAAAKPPLSPGYVGASGGKSPALSVRTQRPARIPVHVPHPVKMPAVKPTISVTGYARQPRNDLQQLLGRLKSAARLPKTTSPLARAASGR